MNDKIIAVLIADSTLTSIVPSKNIMAGPVDITVGLNSDTLMPQINIFTISEMSNTVPLNTRETSIQLDIWSRNGQLEVVNVYERILTLLNYLSADQGSAHIFWEKMGSAVDLYESDRRIFHRACTFRIWGFK
jgi:hypothetical protein